MEKKMDSPFQYQNVRLYRWFTLLYNARAYYPVLAVLFVDLGLRIEDYSRLNALWAVTILILEIPSGALADTIGRRKLVITAAVLMGLEMALLLFAPIDGGALLLGMCILNRLLSGVSEAAASGADQSLAYDTLDFEGKSSLWEDKVLPSVMRWRSAGFVFAMFLGGLMYDAETVNSLFGAIGIETSFTQFQTMRFPIALVFLQSVLCFIIALRMSDPKPANQVETEKQTISDALRLTVKTTRWAFSTSAVLKIIVGTVIIDAFIRNYATVTSEYYREIALPPWSWGLMGASAGLLGMVTPEFAKWLDRRYAAPFALSWIAVIALVGLAGVGLTIPIFGFIPSILCMSTFGLFSYIADNNLHKLADSSKRATLLSVKGLSANLGYGFASLVFAQAVVYAGRPEVFVEGGESPFAKVLSVQPWIFTAVVILYVTWVILTNPKSEKD